MNNEFPENNQKKENNYWVTLEEYKELMEKPKESLNPMEITQTNIFEECKAYQEYIENCKELESQYDGVNLLPASAEKPVSEYNNYIIELNQKENKTPGEQKIINFETARAKKSEELKNTESNIRNFEQEKVLSRTRKKAGYVDAAILLAIIFNVGFIIAMIMLKK